MLQEEGLVPRRDQWCGKNNNKTVELWREQAFIAQSKQTCKHMESKHNDGSKQSYQERGVQ